MFKNGRIEEPPAQLVSCDLKNADLADVLKLFSDQTEKILFLVPMYRQ
jgi:hypothetical protein